MYQQDCFSLIEKEFEENYRRLYHLAYKLTGNYHDAEDVVQEAYLNALAHWDGFKGKSSVYTWLYRITVNCSYKYMKKAGRLPVQLLSEKLQQPEKEVIAGLPRTSPEEESLLVNEMREACLNGFMKCLPSKQRVAFTLRVVLELSPEDVAEIMETSKANVKVLVHRARKFMRELMENRCSLLDEKNPCQCKIWVAFALDKGIILSKPSPGFGNVRSDGQIGFAQGADSERWPEFVREVDILKKIRLLHQQGRVPEDFSAFRKKMKKLLKEGDFKILS